MKKIIFFVLTIGLISAQNIVPKPKVKTPFTDGKFNFGVHAGLNISSLSTSLPDYFNKNYLGFRGGLFARVNFNKFYIQPEINFSQVGGEGLFGNTPGRIYGSKANTLEIPVLLGFKLINLKVINLRAYGGGFWAWNMTNDISVNDVVFPENNTSVTSEKAGRYNGGLILGAGVDIWRFTLDARYQWGLANMFGTNTLFQDARAGFQYGTFNVTLGVKIW